MMKKLPTIIISRTFLLVKSFLLAFGISSFVGLPFKKVRDDLSFHGFDNDPIRFKILTKKKRVLANEEIEITVSAYYTAISPTLLYTFEGSNSFRLKILLPEGFIQTGGDYTDHCGTTLTNATPNAQYTLKGYFSRTGVKPQFYLLRGNSQADANSLFVVKDELTLEVRPAARPALEALDEPISHSSEPVVQQAARVAFADCSFDSSTPIIS
ncbi:hypothetical protein [Spirosoma radiotolerans]|uniref:Uncharacterized protein n=1 Tax=Spirosoma radiotolerans TaxID=1379870 RepID=A0A0E3ZSV5_9BACT|nr:hypothetical protein [Spirosoma radiotolerans]AKD53538.1 hypothetical protein SD10_00105 [Spirosoma radiotolerans]